MFNNSNLLEIVCFTGSSGLTDYSVSMARAFSGRACLVTSSEIPKYFYQFGFKVHTPFRKTRNYPLDLIKFIFGTILRSPPWMLWQGPLKFALIDGVAARFLRFCGVRCAITIHDILPHYPRAWSRWTHSFYYRSFDKVIVHSTKALENIRKFGVKAPALIIPHGVYDIFQLRGLTKADAREQINGLSYSHDSIIVLFFGHIETRKGIFEFLKIPDKFKLNSRYIFLIAGKSSLSRKDNAELNRLIASQKNIIFHDKRIPFEEVELYFSASDIVVLPYLEGSTSGVLKLAYAFGRPVVASEIGDLNEQITLRDGLIVPLGSRFIDRFASSISEIADNLGIFTSQSIRSKNHLEWGVLAEKIESFLSNDL